MDRSELLSITEESCRYDIDRIESMSKAPFAAELGITLVYVSKERTVARMPVCGRLLNSLGIVHGAATFGLIDHAFGVACNIGCDAVGQCCSVHYYRPATEGPLTAEAVLMNESRSIVDYDVKVFGGGKLIASAVCTGFKLGEKR
jgi:acyl-CoA thioesterase